MIDAVELPDCKKQKQTNLLDLRQTNFRHRRFFERAPREVPLRYTWNHMKVCVELQATSSVASGYMLSNFRGLDGYM